VSDGEAEEILAAANLVARGFRRLAWVGIPFEDLVQIAVVGAMRGRENFDPTRGEYRAWLRTYARGEIQHWLRDHAALVRFPREFCSGHRKGTVDTGVVSLDVPDVTRAEALADPRAEQQYGLVDVLDAIGRLTDPQKRAVFLYYFAGMTQERIGRVMRIGQKNVSRVLFQARESIRRASA
jgi:RNA polymerase sigma factor (sigma-70 family)